MVNFSPSQLSRLNLIYKGKTLALTGTKLVFCENIAEPTKSPAPASNNHHGKIAPLKNTHPKLTWRTFALAAILPMAFGLLMQPRSGQAAGETRAYTPPAAKVQNLDTGLPATHQLALKRINAYRVGAGLKPWRYDSSLTAMGQAHAKYGLINCKARRPYGGHFQNKDYPGYSEAGHIAARTSGLAYAKKDALAGLESLIAAPFHRVQFMDPVLSRVGVGHSYENRCGITLFVARPDGKPTAWPKGTPRFILFPPRNFQDALTEFKHEQPDPRPKAYHGKLTGTVISIHLSPEDTSDFEDAEFDIRDSSGNAIAAWVRHPAKPAVTKPPGIYPPEILGRVMTAFRRNHYAVFAMTKKPLKPGTTYKVNARLKIDGKSHKVEWSFRTRSRTVWNINAGDNRPWQSLAFALKHHQSGDVIRFGPGRHEFNVTDWLHRDLIIQGAGPGKTTLFSNRRARFNIKLAPKGRLVLRDLTYDSSVALLHMSGTSSALLRNVRIKGRARGHFFIIADPGSKLYLADCDLRGVKSNWSIFIRGRGRTAPPASVILGPRNHFRGPGVMSRGKRENGKVPDSLF